MSDRVPVDIEDVETVDEDLAEEPTMVRPPTPAPAPSGSVLGRLRASREAIRSRTEVVLPLIAYDGLAVRYRALTDDEQREMGKALERADKLAKKVGDSDDEKGTHRELEAAALVLVRSCVELLFVGGDGQTEPLVDALAAEGVDTQGSEPMVWDRRTGRVLTEAGVIDGLAEGASSVPVVLHLHYHPGNRNHDALGVAVAQWRDRLSAADSASLDEVLQGT